MFKQHSPLFSEFHIVIPDNYWKSLAYHLSMSRDGSHESPLLGEILQQAALISQQQIQVALREQKDYTELKIGEILALHGWIAQETADFFAKKWLDLLYTPRCYPIGYYLQQAFLLNKQQIQRILKEQQRMNLPFGELAVLDGFLKPQTRDFFLTNLPPREIFNPKSAHSTIEIAQNIIDNLPPNDLDKKREGNTIHALKVTESTIEITQKVIRDVHQNDGVLEITEETIPWID